MQIKQISEVEQFTQRAGFVYVLSNPSMPGILKIGSTERSIRERVTELSATTGIPTPFAVEYYILVENPAEYEFYLHDVFAEYRVNEKREFFKIDTEIALKIIEKLRISSLIDEIEYSWPTEKEIEFIRQYKCKMPMSQFCNEIDESIEDYIISLLDELSTSSLSKLKVALDKIYSKRPELLKYDVDKVLKFIDNKSCAERKEFVNKIFPLLMSNENIDNKLVTIEDLLKNMSDDAICRKLEKLFSMRPNVWRMIRGR